MVLDAHDRAFAFFRGTCERRIYDNMKSVVDTILIGKERISKCRFLQMCGRCLIEPPPARRPSGHEKGPVEN